MSKSFLIISMIFSYSFIFSQPKVVVNKAWEYSFGQPSEYNWGNSTLDNSENLITIGHSTIDLNSTQLLIEKQNPEGDVLWESSFEAIPNSKNYGAVITTDHNGNIYVAGVSSVDGTQLKNNYLILKYSPDGIILWHTEIDGTGQNNDIPTSINVDILGNVYVTGLSMGSNSELDYLTIRLDSQNGNLIWQNRYDYNNSFDVPIDLSFDHLGNLIITGTSAQSISQWDIAVMKYSPVGVILQEERISNSSFGFDQPSGIAIDTDGSIYITGTSITIGGTSNAKTLKLDSDFNLLWSEIYDGGQVDSISGIQIAPTGNINLVGWQSNGYGGSEILSLQYTSTGNLNWVKHRKAPFKSDNAKAQCVTLDDTMGIFLLQQLFKKKQRIKLF